MQKIKIKKYIKLFSVLFVLSVGFTSCLKDTDVAPLTGTDGSNDVIMFLDNGGSTGGGATTFADPFPLYNFSFNLVNDTAGFDVNVYYGPLNAAPQDITVQLALNKEAVDSFNIVNQIDSNSLYTVPEDDAIYSFPASVTIPKGQHLVKAHVVITGTPSYDYGANYALPISIVSTNYGIISSNFGTEINAFVVKNQYDGDYSIEGGTIQRYSAPGVPTIDDALNGDLTGNPDVDLVTVGANTLEIQGLTWHGGSSGVAGIDNLRITIDPTTNLVTVKALGNATLANINGAVNKYDPDTKTFTLNFDWNQTTTPRTVKNLTLKYAGER
ncbi:hypothetical protein A9P82_11880 [Arachidicoccus ginsenosidimutans]|uniref:DUF1735 domain-containing protein n=1 Tax=Arachidicoccus sp. BS20 TaxID=1850526 RepID=UPI0007F15F1B|nr:DUF1735 domain-containing protein [Arachidicoccus sp. BS20]ANI89925.1 hypothetical protein A9P82_11880 [Arachidicoccus sp. BS20]